MYKLFLSLRYLRKRLIALFAVGSVTLCVFMVLVVISVMGGFLEMVKERSRGLLSDIVVDNATLQGFPHYQEFIDALQARMPDVVVTATPVIYNYAILRVQATKYTKPVRVVGIRLDKYEQVNDFANSLWYDRFYPGTTSLGLQLQPVAGWDEHDNRVLPEPFESAHQKWRQTASAEELAEYDRMPYSPPPGARVFAQTVAPPGYVGGDEFEAEDLYGVIIGCDVINERTKTGDYLRHYALDSEMLLTLLPMTREGTVSGEGSTTLSLRYADDSRTRVFEIDDLCVYVDFDMLQSVLAMNPQEPIDGGFAPAVSVVAVVLIGCIFYMVVEKKTRDIGIVKSLGASSSGVAAIFILYGAAVGVVGSIIGSVAGVFFVRNINEIQDALARLNPNLQVWSPDVYTFDRIPNSVDPVEAVVIVVVAIVASMLGALIPALLAARVWPVDALRYE